MGTRAMHIIPGRRPEQQGAIAVDVAPSPSDLVIHGVAMSAAGALMFSLIAGMSMFLVMSSARELADMAGIVDDGIVFADFAALVGATFGGAAAVGTIAVRLLCPDPRGRLPRFAAAVAALLPTLVFVAHDMSAAKGSVAAIGPVVFYLTAIAAAAGASLFAEIPERWVA